MAVDTFTPQKNYILMGTGNDIGVWGINLNSNFSIIDNNLGGTLSLNVGGNSNINVSSSQAEFLIHDLTGALTGNINYNFPNLGGFYAINNQTTGAFTLTATVQGGSSGITIPQNNTTTIYIDSSVPQVEALSGTNYVFVGGTATNPVSSNAIVIDQTFPPNFSLNTGTVVAWFGTAFNTGSPVTMSLPTGGVQTIVKPAWSGLVELIPGDIIPGIPNTMTYDGTVWVIGFPLTAYENTVTTNTAVTLASGYIPYVTGTSVNITYSFTTSANLTTYWSCGIYSPLGQSTVTLDDPSDIINFGTPGAGITIPTGGQVSVTTDANGNYFMSGTGTLPPHPTLSSITFNSTTGIIGSTTNDSAPVGSVGYFTSVTTTVGSGSVSLSNATTGTAASLTLSAGDWDVWGTAYVSLSAVTSAAYVTGIGTSAIVINGSLGANGFNSPAFSVSAYTNNIGYPIAPIRASVASSATYYLFQQLGFSGGTASAFGTISARRRR